MYTYYFRKGFYFMDLTTQKIMVDPEFVKKILTLKSKAEIREELLKHDIELTDEDFEQYTQLMLEIVKSVKNKKEVSTQDLEEIAGGQVNKAVATVGRVISFPFRAVAYGTGAVLAGLPKGFIDGAYDSWTNWEHCNEEGK